MTIFTWKIILNYFKSRS